MQQYWCLAWGPTTASYLALTQSCTETGALQAWRTNGSKNRDSARLVQLLLVLACDMMLE